MRVIGTAGHVDHGKSTLVRWLTGIDPDRLAEEKAREMTIDLGFAWLKLADGETVGIVDVPGHRDFIENMLAGVGGIDAALLVIAADEGVMPQTREHLAILDLLGIHNGLVVLTKIDAVDDPAWLELVEQDIAALVQGTTLAGAKIVRVSARANVGQDDLVSALIALLASIPPAVDHHHPRLSIDRVFTISGFGTVVTGTLLGGHLRAGDDIELQPTGLRGRIRGLHSYNQSVDIAEPGSRIAVNLSGIEKKAVSRGDLLTSPAYTQPTTLLDAHFRHLKDAPRPLKHNAQVKIFVGAAEVIGRVRLLADETLPPGVEGWLQFDLEKPIAVAQGDRFILRYPSPPQTIGGGVVVNPHPERRWRRFQDAVLHDLATRLLGTPEERVTQVANQIEPVTAQVIERETGLSDHELQHALHRAIEKELLVSLDDESFYSLARLNQIVDWMIHELSAFHKVEPLRLGMPREEFRSRIGVKGTTLSMILERQNRVVTEGNIVRLAEHHIQFTEQQTAKIQALMRKMTAARFAPPSVAEAVQIVGEPVLRALIDLSEIVQVGPDVIFARPTYDEMVGTILDTIDANGDVTVGALRDHFATSRKFAIGLLEHLDTIGLTRRVGDVRVRNGRSH